MTKIAGKTYISIPALLFRSDQGRDILVVPKNEIIFLTFILFSSNNFDNLGTPMGALLKQKVIHNKTLLFWKSELGTRWHAMG